MPTAGYQEQIAAQPADIGTGRYRSFRRTLWAAVLFLAACALGLAAWSASWLLEPNRYAAVLSIETKAVYRDPALMKAAWRLPVARLYGPQNYLYQENQSFCGPASIADLLRSVGDVRPQDAVLEGTPYHPRFGFLLGGLTLDQLADVLRQRTGRPVTVERGLSLTQFRQELAHLNDPSRRTIANFHRGPLFGRGHGHFSPLLGYLASRDLVLVGDVNPSYRPFLVSSARLWRAVNTVDSATGRKRGLLTVTVRLKGEPFRVDALGLLQTRATALKSGSSGASGQLYG